MSRRLNKRSESFQRIARKLKTTPFKLGSVQYPAKTVKNLMYLKAKGLL